MVYDLAEMFDSLPPDVKKHCLQTGRYVTILFQQSDILSGEYCFEDNELLQAIKDGGKYHDIGKLAVSEMILHSNIALSEIARKIVSYHPGYAGYLITHSSDYQYMSEMYKKCVLDMCMFHHEKWDGTGYPNGLKGDQIPVLAQLCSVADAFDAMTSNRTYRDAYTPQKAFEIICEARGTQFSPYAVSALVRAKNQLFDICTNQMSYVKH